MSNPFAMCDPEYLASLNNAYKAAEVSTGGTMIIPEGKYQVFVSRVYVDQNEYLNVLQLVLELTILEGPMKGVTVTKYLSMAAERMGYLKQDLYTMGVDIGDDIMNLGEEDVLRPMLDMVLDITIKHKKKQTGNGVYQNIYINKRAGKYSDQPIDDPDNPWG